MAGETALEQAGESTRTVVGAEAAHYAYASVGSGAAGIGGPFGIVGVTIASAVSLVLNQVSYDKKRDALLDLYRDEVAAQVGKHPDKVKIKDLERVANGDPKGSITPNKTIAEGLDKLKSRRNIGMIVTAGAILGTLALLGAAAATGMVPTLFTGGGLLAAAGNIAVKAFIGFAIHSALERPIHWAAKKVFRMEENTQDRITELHRQHRNGKAISREQVVGVFVSANKQLDEFVKGQFGKDFDELTVQQKRAITDSFEQYLPVTSITENLNSGRVKISELAFAVEGQTSGVAPGSVKNDLSLVGKVRVAAHHENKPEVAPHTPPVRKVVEYDNPTPKQSFTSRLAAERGRSGVDAPPL